MENEQVSVLYPNSNVNSIEAFCTKLDNAFLDIVMENRNISTASVGNNGNFPN